MPFGNAPRFPSRSSNRTCGFPASGFPTGFTVRPTISCRVTRGACAAASSSSPRDTARSDRSGHCRVFAGSSANHPDLAVFASAPEVRALPSAGITRLQRSLRPCPTPAGIRRPSATLRPLPSCQTGLPRLPASPFRRAVPTTPADRTGARVDCFPVRAAFPVLQAGRHPHLYFRGLLRLHSRYGPSDCSTAQGGLCHEASSQSGYPSKPLVSYQSNRQFSGWYLPPLVIRAFGAHCKN